MIVFNLKHQLDDGWECRFLIRESSTTHWHLLEGEPGKWLRERGHSSLILECEQRDYNDDYFLEIEDPSLAILFKLTWL